MSEIILLGVVVLLGVLFNVALLTTVLFWYETAWSNHRRHLEHLSGGHVGRMILRTALWSIFSMLAVVLLYPWGYWRKVKQTELDPSCLLPPVILIHGLYHNASGWVLYRWWLRRAGFANVFAMNYSSWNTSFEEVLAKAARFVEEVGRKFPGQPVMLVGHSLGGLVSRALVQRYGSRIHAAAVVTLGTPHQGSKLAVFGVGKLARSLIYRGPLIQSLEEEPSDLNTRCLALYSPLDNMVLPNEALRPRSSSWQQEESSPLSHVGMLFHRSTAARAIRHLLESTSH
ncbi:MAG: alpha/beta fold hydrolase [Syntrophobacteraceae bacterium]|nr:alpha/beta fold hydrolase [Syntrophobacteraceae bacterium]